jgi:hypothetical protein
VSTVVSERKNLLEDAPIVVADDADDDDDPLAKKNTPP